MREQRDGKESKFIETDRLWAASPRTPATIEVISFSFSSPSFFYSLCVDIYIRTHEPAFKKNKNGIILLTCF